MTVPAHHDRDLRPKHGVQMGGHHDRRSAGGTGELADHVSDRIGTWTPETQGGDPSGDMSGAA